MAAVVVTLGTLQLAIATQPSSAAQSGVALAQQPALQVEDGAGKAKSQGGVAVTAAIASGPQGTSSLANPTATTNANGLAAFSGLAITGPAGDYTLSFNASGLTSIVSNTITLSATPQALSTDLNANGSDGPITVDLGAPVTLTWRSTGAIGCFFVSLGYGHDNTRLVPVSGSQTFASLRVPVTFVLGCIDRDNHTVVDTVAVRMPLTFTALAPWGVHHTCGLTTLKDVVCWGDQQYGEVGGPGGVSLGVGLAGPVVALEGTAFTDVSTGRQHSCAVAVGGTVYCWGYNRDGQLGDGTQSVFGRADPSPVVGSTTFTQVAAGGPGPCSFAYVAPGCMESHTCALTASGAPWCWGADSLGQLGRGGTLGAPQPTPAPVAGGLAFTQIRAGGAHTCGLTTRGEAWCWGNNVNGQLGNGEWGFGVYEPAPVLVGGGHTFRAVAAGRDHSCALASTGTAYCWGFGGDGELGNGTTNGSNMPVAVGGGGTYAAVTAGEFHTCALATGGAAYCWGDNSRGQLGDGTTTSRLLPVAVTGGHVFTAIAAGELDTCGLTSSGEAYCWGQDDWEQLGTRATETCPVPSLPTPVPVACITRPARVDGQP